MLPKKGQIRCPETSVSNCQYFTLFEGVRGLLQISVILGHKNCCKLKLTAVPLEIFFPAVKVFFNCGLYGIRHRAVCLCHKSDWNLKLARFMCGNISATSCMAMESEHTQQAQRLTTSRPARPLLTVTIPCVSNQQSHIHIQDLNPNWNGSTTHRKTQTTYLTNMVKKSVLGKLTVTEFGRTVVVWYEV
jgi:hypothetical protein